MRPALALNLCLALFQAFLLAPVQHVHDHDGPDEHHETGHAHSVIVHAHFAPHVGLSVRPGERVWTEPAEHAAWSLDTFTIVVPAEAYPVLPARAPEVLFAPRVTPGAVETIEERAHDPPARRFSIPRAPPA